MAIVDYAQQIEEYRQEYLRTPVLFRIKRELLIHEIDYLLQQRSKGRKNGIAERCFGDVEFGGRE